MSRSQVPGSPSLWNVPHLRNPNFTGRNEVLEVLHSVLTSSLQTAPVQALSGLGGIGKTQLAIEYAYSHRGDYDLVWWLRAEEPTTLAAEYAELATVLRLPQSRIVDQRIQIEAVKQWLGQRGGWLLVFDNAREVGEVRQYLPQDSAGHVLITSRNPNWRGVAGTLSVEVMNESEAVEFLRKRTGQTSDGAGDLAEALGYLPLALEQAGAYIEETDVSFGVYLDLFRSHQRELLSRPSPATDYPLTVATTWELSFRQVLNNSLAGAELLNLCSFLAPDEIPFNILRPLRNLPFNGQHPLSHLVFAMSDQLIFNDAVAALRRFSLVNTHGESLSFHRLVQAVTRDRLTGDDWRKTAEVALHLVNWHFPGDVDPDDIRTWRVPPQLLPHALVVSDHAALEKVEIGTALRLLNQVGYHLKQLANLVRARAVLEKALSIGESNNFEMSSTGIKTNLGAVLSA